MHIHHPQIKLYQQMIKKIQQIHIQYGCVQVQDNILKQKRVIITQVNGIVRVEVMVWTSKFSFECQQSRHTVSFLSNIHHLEKIAFYVILIVFLAVSQMLGEKGQRERVWLLCSVANSHDVHPTILFQIKDRNLEAQVHPDPLSTRLLLLTHA